MKKLKQEFLEEQDSEHDPDFLPSLELQPTYFVKMPADFLRIAA